MNACVLCPGPSLGRFLGDPSRPQYDLTIGVNRAVEAISCDYWVALDTCTFGLTMVVGKPMLVTGKGHYRQMCRRWPAAEEFEHLDLMGLTTKHLPSRWRTKSFLTAIVLAYTKGATEIDCYGVDWKGSADFDGRTFPEQKRTEKRWAKESRSFEELKAALRRRGVTVARMEACWSPVPVTQESVK
jgi:hypothetical protein